MRVNEVGPNQCCNCMIFNISSIWLQHLTEKLCVFAQLHNGRESRYGRRWSRARAHTHERIVNMMDLWKPSTLPGHGQFLLIIHLNVAYGMCSYRCAPPCHCCSTCSIGASIFTQPYATAVAWLSAIVVNATVNIITAIRMLAHENTTAKKMWMHNLCSHKRRCHQWHFPCIYRSAPSTPAL